MGRRKERIGRGKERTGRGKERPLLCARVLVVAVQDDAELVLQEVVVGVHGKRQAQVLLCLRQIAGPPVLHRHEQQRLVRSGRQ